MRVLVTGASGLIGSAVCDALLVRGDEVVGLSRDPEKARSSNPTVRWHEWDAINEEAPPEAFEDVDGVIHLLGEPINQRWTDEAKERIMGSRRTGTRNLVATIKGLDRKPKVLVSQSAIGYYGDRGDAVLDESAGPGEGFDSQVVVEWEKAAQEAEGTGMRLVITRSGLILDPEGGLLKQLLTPFKLGVGGPVGSGDQYMSWIHRDDEVELLLWALDNEKVGGVVNATAPNPVTNRELSKTLGKVLRRPAFMPVPNFALTLMLGGELAETVKGGQRVMPKRAEELGYLFEHPELEGALRELLR